LEYSGLNEVPECNSEALLELQVLSTLYAAENVRADLDRNILEVKAMPPLEFSLWATKAAVHRKSVSLTFAAA